jgi:Ca2+/Na+ antiporter
LSGLFGLVTVVFTVPFIFVSLTDEQEKAHAFHNIGAGLAFSIVLGAGLLLAAWKPKEKLAPFQAAFLASLMMAIAALLGGDLISGTYFAAPVILVVLAFLHPARAELWTLGRVRPSLLVLWIVWSVPAIAYATTQADLQRDNPVSDPHVDLHHYSGAAAAAFGVLAAALVASLGTRGTRAAGWIAGLSGALLGLTSLAFSDRVSAFDTPWAWLALLWGIAFIGASEFECRRDAPA